LAVVLVQSEDCPSHRAIWYKQKSLNLFAIGRGILH